MQPVLCPHCRAAIQNEPQFAGTVCRCYQCGGQFQMPAFQPDASPPAFQIDTHASNPYSSPVDPQHYQPYRGPIKSSGLAAVLSFFWTGLGQIYNGQIGMGLVMMLVQILNAFLVIFGIGLVTWPLLWVWGMVDAYNTAERINRRGH